MNVLNEEPAFLQVDLSQSVMEECESKALFPGSDSTSTFPTHPTMAPPPKVESQVSMTMEVSELLLQAALDTSSQALGSPTPKKTSIYGPKSHILSWAGRFWQTCGHLLSGITTGEHSR